MFGLRKEVKRGEAMATHSAYGKECLLGGSVGQKDRSAGTYLAGAPAIFLTMARTSFRSLSLSCAV